MYIEICKTSNNWIKYVYNCIEKQQQLNKMQHYLYS